MNKTARNTKSVGESASAESQTVAASRSVVATPRPAILQDRRPAVTLNSSHEQEATAAAKSAMRAPTSGASKTPKTDQSQTSSKVLSPGYPGLGTGRPLSPPLRQQFEQAFSWDFSAVRLHTDSAADKAATKEGARAFTSGNHIVFGNKVKDPESGGQRQLLAHELAHVVQQGIGAGARPKPAAGTPISRVKPLAASMSSAPPGKTQADPIVTAVNSPAEIGVGRTIEATATAAGARPLDWLLPGAPAGVTITPRGRRTATIRANAASIASAGAAFNVRASLRGAAPPDTHDRAAPVTLIGITALNFAPAPPFQANIATVIAPPTPSPANTADPNRGGLAGNTATVAPVTPVPRPGGFTLALLAARGATAAGLIVTPGVPTGDIRLRVTDNATGTSRDGTLPVSPVPVRLTRFAGQVASGAGVYGCVNTMIFAPSHAFPPAAFDRTIGETIAAGGRDDFLLLPRLPLTLVPILAQSAPANNWNDNVATGIGAVAGAAGDANTINVNRYVGPGVAAGLPRVTDDRQGFHFLGWAGNNWSTEFSNGIHRVSLVRRGANFFFITEHFFPGARARPFVEAYAGPPLIVFPGITAAAPLAPPAAQLAADGVATANVTVRPPLPAGRLVNWDVIGGPIVFTAPAAGVAAPVANAATVQAGLVPGTFRVRVADSVFPNRRFDGTVRVVPVRLRGMAAPVARVPAGTLTALVNILADPGGRNIDWVVDPISMAAGVLIAGNPVAAPAVANPARAATVTKPNAAWTGRVTVTAADRNLPAQRRSIVIVFL